MKRVKDLAVVIGTYEKGGETKKRYQNIGVLMEGENGQFILLDPLINLAAVPREAGKDRVMVSMFDPKDKDSSQTEPSKSSEYARAKANGYAPEPKHLDDDIPF